ncbi:MAG: sigma-70 family RNA polymerase sigma factor [Gemmatimonadales bacterium]|nr:sigma-70 family RNA polymerase sigma factor [Gemmatimonadales bacterium]
MRLALFRRSPEEQSLPTGTEPPAQTLTAELEELFLEAYRRLHGRVLDHAERFLDKDDASDAVGEAMSALWRRWRTLAPEKRTDQYVFGVVHYCVFAKLRERKEFVSLDDAGSELDQAVMNAAEERSGRDAIAEVLDETLTAMPPRRREVFLLIREESFTYREAAEALGVSEGSINTHMRLANEQLRSAFTRAGFRIALPKPPARLPSPMGGADND